MINRYKSKTKTILSITNLIEHILQSVSYYPQTTMFAPNLVHEKKIY